MAPCQVSLSVYTREHIDWNPMFQGINHRQGTVGRSHGQVADDSDRVVQSLIGADGERFDPDADIPGTGPNLQPAAGLMDTR